MLEVIEGLGYSLIFYDIPETGKLPVKMPGTFKQYRPVLQALLKIHTDQVDIMGKLTAGIRQNYIATSWHEDKRFLEVEADMYADLFARFIIYTLMNDTAFPTSMQDFRTMYTNVFFRLLTLKSETESRLREQVSLAVKKDHKAYIDKKHE